MTLCLTDRTKKMNDLSSRQRIDILKKSRASENGRNKSGQNDNRICASVFVICLPDKACCFYFYPLAINAISFN